MTDKKLGMLLGVHIGDSLGATLEFKDPNILKNHKEIIGGGTFQWRAGQATDDTDLTIAVLKSIKNNSLDETVLKQELINWYHGNPKDIGETTRLGIKSIMMGVKPKVLDSSQGNGSMMRCSPLALLNINDDDLLKTSTIQTSLTHPHTVCVFTDYVYIKLLKMALNGSSKSEIFNEAIFLMKDSKILTNLLYEMIATKWQDLKTSGYCVHSLMCAIWALYHCKSFEESLIEVVNRGDDADTSGAITGALCGAYYGLDQIPQRWLSKIERKHEIISLYNAI